jgi:hypothetical protein
MLFKYKYPTNNQSKELFINKMPNLLVSIYLGLVFVSCDCMNTGQRSQSDKPYQSDPYQSNKPNEPEPALSLVPKGPTYFTVSTQLICLQVEKSADDSVAVDISKLTLQINRVLGRAASIFSTAKGVAIDQDVYTLRIQQLGGVGVLIKFDISPQSDTEAAFAFQLLYEDKPIGNKLTFTWRATLDAASQAMLDAIQDLSKKPADIVTLFNNENVNIQDKSGNTPLNYAMKRGDPAIIKPLLGLGADVDAANSSGMRPLYQAVYDNEPELVKLLIDAKADVSKTSSNSAYGEETPLWRAVYNNKPEVVKLLINAKADVNEVRGKKTLLWRAVYNNKPEVVKLLIDAKADINKPSKGKWTPLYQATHIGNAALVELLLAAGANPDQVSFVTTPREFAQKFRPVELQNIFAKYPKSRT